MKSIKQKLFGYGITNVGTQHVEAGVRKIEHAHHAEDQRQARAEHEEQQPVAQPVQHRDDEKFHVRGSLRWREK
jgi:hypothetical protein